MKLQDFTAEIAAQFPAMTLLSVTAPEPGKAGGELVAKLAVGNHSEVMVTRNVSDGMWSVLTKTQSHGGTGMPPRETSLPKAARRASIGVRLKILPLSELAAALAPGVTASDLADLPLDLD